jgi:two-component sensor histidine kinase
MGLACQNRFFTDNKDTGFGLNLIKMLVCQLDGSISFSNKNGAEYTIIFPI